MSTPSYKGQQPSGVCPYCNSGEFENNFNVIANAKCIHCTALFHVAVVRGHMIGVKLHEAPLNDPPRSPDALP